MIIDEKWIYTFGLCVSVKCFFLLKRSPLDHLLLNQGSNQVRIIGGQDADIADYPYQVSVAVDDIQRCGGAIISNTLILTSAFCVYFLEANNVTIRAGSSNRSDGGQIFNVKKINSHSNYVIEEFGNNIAVLELVSPLTYGLGVQPIQLANDSKAIVEGKNATFTGWGRQKIDDWKLPDQLQVSNVSLFSTESCIKNWGSSITSAGVCAGGDGIYGCDGDSGGPLVVDGVLQGILDLITCGLVDVPDVYTNVPEYLDFINPFLELQ